MLFAITGELNESVPYLVGQFVSSGHGMSHAHHGPIEIVVAGMLGTLAGFVAGLLVSKIVRFIAFSAGREGGKARWAIFGAIAGGIIGALWEAVGE